MIVKKYIEDTLTDLDKLYNATTSNKKLIYYSKLDIIEICGWLEESMDDVIIRYCNRCLRESANNNFVKKKVSNTYGFEYKRHFRPLLLYAVGMKQLEKFERQLDKNGNLSILKSQLGTLKIKRNDAAHTFLKGVTKTYDAPSITLNTFRTLYPILKEIETEIRKL